MPGTSAGGIPIPLDGDPVSNGAESVRNLAADIGDAWITYVPALTATTSNPNFGSGSSAAGAYRRVGKTVHWRAYVQCGTGTTAGSGNYAISLPVAAAASMSGVAGSVLIVGGATAVGVVAMYTTTSVNMYCPALVTSGSNNVIDGRGYYMTGTYQGA